MRGFALCGALAALASCGDDNNAVSNAENARLAYLGIDRSIDRSIDLAMQGYNMAGSANVPAQQAMGGVSGTLSVVGQVSRGTGSSGNSQVRLSTTYTSYADAVALGDGGTLRITYNGAQLADRDLNLSLRDIPTGTFQGTLVRPLTMSGDLTGDVTLNVSFTGMMQAAAGGGIQRAPGTTRITGTATSRYGTYAIDVTR